MSAQERLAEIVKSGRTAPMRVVHPERGEMVTQAYCGFDAILFALGEWGLPYEEAKRMKVYLDEKRTPPTACRPGDVQ